MWIWPPLCCTTFGPKLASKEASVDVAKVGMGVVGDDFHLELV